MWSPTKTVSAGGPPPTVCSGPGPHAVSTVLTTHTRTSTGCRGTLHGSPVSHSSPWQKPRCIRLALHSAYEVSVLGSLLLRPVSIGNGREASPPLEAALLRRRGLCLQPESGAGLGAMVLAVSVPRSASSVRKLCTGRWSSARRLGQRRRRAPRVPRPSAAVGRRAVEQQWRQGCRVPLDPVGPELCARTRSSMRSHVVHRLQAAKRPLHLGRFDVRADDVQPVELLLGRDPLLVPVNVSSVIVVTMRDLVPMTFPTRKPKRPILTRCRRRDDASNSCRLRCRWAASRGLRHTSAVRRETPRW